MEFDLYEQGKELLRNDDNIEWIDKIICWVKRSQGIIYTFFKLLLKIKEKWKIL